VVAAVHHPKRANSRLDVVYPFSVEEQAFVPQVCSQPEVAEAQLEELEKFDSLCVVR
jgi:hypothetical protein